MVSAISLCILAIGLNAAASQLVPSDVEFPESPVPERRTFKNKPIKLLPLGKKYKKFGGFVPHVFGKPSYAEIPIVQEVPKPFYRVHRYQGIEVKPVPEVLFSTPEPLIEANSIELPSKDFVPADHFLPAPVHSSSILLLPITNKPVLASPPSPFVYAPFPPPPPKPLLSFAPVPPQPVFSSIPINSLPPSPTAFSSIPIAHPTPTPIQVIPPPAPVFSGVSASLPSNPLPPPPSQTIFSPVPIKIQTPIVPPLTVPSPPPILSSIPAKIQAPFLPPITAPSPPNVFSSVSVKIPAPVLPPVPASALPSVPIPSPSPVLPTVSAVSPTPEPVFSSLPVSLPPPQFSAIPSPSPSITVFPPPAPALTSISVSATQEPEFSYPPSGTPIPSQIKDVTLTEIQIKDSPVPTIGTPKYEEVTHSLTDGGSLNLANVFGVFKNENGFFHKIKEWKTDKATAALNHFTQFKQKPIIQPSVSISHPNNKVPVEIPPPEVPVYPTLQFPAPVQPLPLAPAPVFFPSAQFFPPSKYENFPPNIESPPLLNSYGVPIPRDSYLPAHTSHDRLSSAASEEEPALAPAPSTEKNEQSLDIQQQSYQVPQEFQTQQFQSQFQPQASPVYVPEDNTKTVKEEKSANEEVQTDISDYKTQKESEEVPTSGQNYPNHKER